MNAQNPFGEIENQVKRIVHLEARAGAKAQAPEGAVAQEIGEIEGVLRKMKIDPAATESYIGEIDTRIGDLTAAIAERHVTDYGVFSRAALQEQFGEDARWYLRERKGVMPHASLSELEDTLQVAERTKKILEDALVRGRTGFLGMIRKVLSW